MNKGDEYDHIDLRKKVVFTFKKLVTKKTEKKVELSCFDVVYVFVSSN